LIPALFGAREFVEVGGLMSYGSDYPAMFRRAGNEARLAEVRVAEVRAAEVRVREVRPAEVRTGVGVLV
jgi:hypothetical protein